MSDYMAIASDLSGSKTGIGGQMGASMIGYVPPRTGSAPQTADDWGGLLWLFLGLM